MGTYGKGKVSLSSQTTKARRDYMDVRAARMSWKRSKVVELLIARWFADGAPALCPAEAQLGIAPLPSEALKD
jgi:hypothetical protein